MIDLVLNQTNDVGAPVPFVEFLSLVDQDLDNPNAYSPLFP